MGGWLLVLLTFLAVGAASLATFVTADASAVIRLTARTSLALFVLAFAARPLSQLFRVKWPLAQRRYLGVSFAVSHGFHLAGILVVAADLGFARFAREVGLTGAFGGVGYLFILAMVATSFDATTEWLGRRRWKLLHTTGMYVLAVTFAFTYVGAALETRRPLYLFLAAVSLAPFALRGASAWRRRGRGSPRSPTKR